MLLILFECFFNKNNIEMLTINLLLLNILIILDFSYVFPFFGFGSSPRPKGQKMI